MDILRDLPSDASTVHIPDKDPVTLLPIMVAGETYTFQLQVKGEGFVIFRVVLLLQHLVLEMAQSYRER